MLSTIKKYMFDSSQSDLRKQVVLYLVGNGQLESIWQPPFQDCFVLIAHTRHKCIRSCSPYHTQDNPNLLSLIINHELESLPFSDLKDGGKIQPEGGQIV
jgi:hypothetical protein